MSASVFVYSRQTRPPHSVRPATHARLNRGLVTAAGVPVHGLSGPGCARAPRTLYRRVTGGVATVYVRCSAPSDAFVGARVNYAAVEHAPSRRGHSMDFFEVVHTQPHPPVQARSRPRSGHLEDPGCRDSCAERLEHPAVVVPGRARCGQAATHRGRGTRAYGGSCTGAGQAEQMDAVRRRMRLASIAFRENVASAPVLIIPCLVAPTSPTSDTRACLLARRSMVRFRT